MKSKDKNETIYIKRFVATDGLPKKEGEYIICARCDNDDEKFADAIMPSLFYPKNKEWVDDWGRDVIWWLEEKELPDEAEMENFIKTHPDNTGNFIIGAAVDAGFRVGAKWLKQQITK